MALDTNAALNADLGHEPGDAAPPVDNAARMKQVASLYKRKAQLEAELDRVKKQLDGEGQQVLDWMQQNGVDQVRQDGITLHIRRELWASLATDNMRQVKAALKAAGIDPTAIVKEKANAQTLSAVVREFDKEGRPVPKKLAAVLKVSEVFKLGFRAAA